MASFEKGLQSQPGISHVHNIWGHDRQKTLEGYEKLIIVSRLVWQLCTAMMSWVGCLLKDSKLFILFAENSQIHLKISVIPILLTFIYLVALNLLVNNQPNSSSNSTHHCDR